MNYGIPYMGSKNKIVKYIIDNLPPAENFYDLFAGGCAVTYAAIVSGKYKKFYLNDINPIPLKLFIDAIYGKYENEKRWISRERFWYEKEDDPYIAYCWSFGSMPGKSYAYSDENEKYKKACFYAIVHNKWEQIENFLPNIYKVIYPKLNEINDLRQRYHLFFYLLKSEKKRKNPDFNNETLKKLESVQSISRLFRLQDLKRIKRFVGNNITISNGNYYDVNILPNSTVYCDPPYRNTEGYGEIFDFEKFDNWLRTRDFPVYISEYSMPDDFISIGEIEKKCTMSSNSKPKSTIEKIFIHEKWKDILPKKFKPVSFF